MVEERAGPQAMVWWGLLSAPFIYAGILFFALPPAPPATDLTVPIVLATLGVLQALAAQVLWVRIKRGAFTARTANGTPSPMPIVVWALDEGAAVYGLVIAFLGAPQAWSIGLFAVAVVALLLNPYWTLEEGA